MRVWERDDSDSRQNVVFSVTAYCSETFSLDVFEIWKRHIYSVTIGIAQRVHEYCLELAYCLDDDNWIGKSEHLDKADIAWLKRGLMKSYQAIESLMNERETKTGRRNQVLYALSKVDTRTFTASQIEDILRAEFPDSTKDITLGVGQIMGAGLSGDENPIIKRTSNKSTAYEFVDPRYLMGLRVALRKENEKVIKCEV